MYFFDFADYFISYSEENWNTKGVSGLVIGCSNSPIPADWEDLFSVCRATRDAFYKSVNEWYLVSAESGYTENIDQGCTPSYSDLWLDFVEKKVEYEKYLRVFIDTVHLFRFNYDYSPDKQSTYPTYEDYFNYIYDAYDQQTGTSSNTVYEVVDPFNPNPKSAITVNYNFGTTFETSDLETAISNYDNAMKEMMCSVKNMWSVIDGDTFDELYVDDNGNFIPNSGTTYCLL